MDEFPIHNLSGDIIRDFFGEIPDRPKQLYARGTFPVGKHYVLLTIVGARKYSPYGQEVCRALISGLKGYPVVIVSGLAHGIDSIVHRCAMEAGLLTMGFPGSGLAEDAIYPRQNLYLALEILKAGGCLVSEQPHHEAGNTWTFPKRNRLMAGVSRATLLIEARNQSGSRITARLATEYNRDVLAVPGSIFDENSEAPNELIKLGATPITSAASLLEALGFSPTSQPMLDLFTLCSPEEQSVLSHLARPMRRGDLIRKMDVPIYKANSLITQLEMKGLIQESNGELRAA